MIDTHTHLYDEAFSEDYGKTLERAVDAGVGHFIFPGIDSSVHDRMMEYAGEDRDVADPWYTGNFGETFKDIDKGCRGFLEYLRREDRI